MQHRHSHLMRTAFAVVFFALALSGAAKASSCSIDAVGAVAFGVYDPLNASATDSAGTITYTCNGPGGLLNGSAVVTLSQGSSGNYAQRTMQSGANVLGYNVYVDAARTRVWGDSTGGTFPGFAPVGRAQSLPVYGRMPPGQNVASGSYSDTLTVTFFF
jgi:spore coat protein U-like protein